MSLGEIIKPECSMDRRLRLSVMLALNCGPILKGSKAACIINVNPEEFPIIINMLADTGLYYRLIKPCGKHFKLYLYRENKLYNYMSRMDTAGFLKEYGYCGASVEEMLDRLSRRIILYGAGEIKFPHELGIFLGYPVADVKGFIENEGKNYIYSGYWKVYENAAEAIRIFRQYDLEREIAVREVISGYTIREVAVY